jgi:DNA-binding transcriptional LysR family regulator
MSRWLGFEELVEVVKGGSFSAAAKSLGVSKAHVSQQISKLEERLGTRLLHRTTRKISLSETGQIYYEQCRQIVEDLKTAEQSVTSFQLEAQGLLKISSPHLLGEVLLIPAIADFLKHHPKLDIELDLNSHKVDLISDRYDMAIQVGERKDINVVNRILAPTEFYVVATPDYLQQFGIPIHPEDLKQHNCLLFSEQGRSKPWRFSGPDGPVNIALKSRWRSNSGHALRAGAKQGLGLAYLPDYYLKGDIAEGKLIQVMSEWQSADRNLVAIYQHRRHLSAKIRLFSEFLRGRFIDQESQDALLTNELAD